MKIVVVGLGYVGTANAVLLAQHNEVIGVDLDDNRVELLNSGRSPIEDKDISDLLQSKKLNIRATTDLKSVINGADYVIVATPTNYDEKNNFFDTSSVETVLRKVAHLSPTTCAVVKSTIPVGFIDHVRDSIGTNLIFFSPEFLREGQALFDNLYPSRIIIGDNTTLAHEFAEILKRGARKNNIEVLFTGTREAEAIKLFSNTYLAMRVSFFNELDSYALANGLNSCEIIQGTSLDPRIGNHYNNPSFGYGGYCLPKDTKQLLANFGSVPQKLIGAIVAANETRKNYLVDTVASYKPRVVGIYRLIMKAGSDNFRDAAILDVMRLLTQKGIEIIVFEPGLDEEYFEDTRVETDLAYFKNICDVIITNRNSLELDDVSEKVFTRDLFGKDS